MMAIDLAPIPSGSPTSIAPSLLVCAVFFWTVHRPDLLNQGIVLLLTLLLDATAGLPLGLTAIALFATRLLLLAPPRFLAGQSFLIIWASFCLAASILLSIRWLLASLFFAHFFAFRLVFFEILLTVAAYPLVSFLLALMQSSLPKIANAAPRG
jgi:rod shape-determining protein MreD